MSIQPGHAVLALLAALVAGCGGSSGGGGEFTPPPDPPPPPPSGPPAIGLVDAFPNLPGFVSPLGLDQVPGDDSRFFLIERRGIVYAFAGEGGVSTADVVLDITSAINPSGEGGLLGLAFHPDASQNGEVYLSYTRGSSPLESVISRFDFNPATGVIDPLSESVVLTRPQPASNHNGGDIAFGPDGYLYVAFGDGGGAGDPFDNGQDATNLFGAILRLDVDGIDPYQIPPDNPFAGNTECGAGGSSMECPEIYAWGFRNPWRMSFDRQTGDLWVGDVGQNDWEEIDRVGLGLNYGWNVREGAHCFDPPSGCSTNFVDPITEYGHSLGQSVTGGYVYRGTTFPALQGFYLFGDFVSGRIWAIDAAADQVSPPDVLLDTPHSIASFAEGDDGEIYVLAFGSGRIYRVVDGS